MGCWNGTCGISNLPIFAGDPIRVVILAAHWYKLADPYLVRNPETWDDKKKPEYKDTEGNYHEYPNKELKAELDPEVYTYNRNQEAWRNGWFAGYCYTNEVFFPRTLPLKSKYDDYGGAKDLEDGLNKRIIWAQFQKDLDEYPAGTYNIPEAISRNLSVEEIIDRIERGGVTVSTDSERRVSLHQGRHGGHLPLGLWMVREDIYQAVINAPIVDRWSGKLTLNRYLRDADEFLEELKENKLGKLLAKDKESLSAEELRKYFKLIGSLGKGSSNLVSSTLANEPLENTLGFYQTWLRDKITEGEVDPESDELRDLVHQAAEFGFFRTAMSSMRVGFMPQPGAGSQDDTMSVHIAVAKQILKIAEEYEKQFEDEDTPDNAGDESI